MNEYKIGDIILLTYGNGTQVARVLKVSARGALTVERGQPGYKNEQFYWAHGPSKLKVGDMRIQGILPASDWRRRLPHFSDVTEATA